MPSRRLVSGWHTRDSHAPGIHLGTIDELPFQRSPPMLTATLIRPMLLAYASAAVALPLTTLPTLWLLMLVTKTVTHKLARASCHPFKGGAEFDPNRAFG